MIKQLGFLLLYNVWTIQFVKNGSLKPAGVKHIALETIDYCENNH